MIDLTARPFNLSAEDIAWVEMTKQSMTLDEKIGQLFVAHGFTSDQTYLADLLRRRPYGGFMYRPDQAETIRETHQFLQAHSRIPLLLAANLEMGGTGIASDGTRFGYQMEAAATGDETNAYRLGRVSCAEGAAVGCNWAFAPVVDVDYNFRNPITNIRTYGNDPDRVLSMARAYSKAAGECGIATCIKHFPGDGMDERDQHLVVSVNTSTCEEWDATYGRIYKGLIDDGAMTVMAGSISLPAYQRRFNPNHPMQSIPASLSRELLQDLLRGQLGFNGLIVSDSTVMVGLSAVMPRERMVPAIIESGCDMFLFTRDEDEDFMYMKRGYENGLLSEGRLDDALTRILGMKAALGLHRRQQEGTLVPPASALQDIRTPQSVAWAEECADQAVTLVKDTQHLLPVSPQRYRRVLLEIVGTGADNDRVRGTMQQYLAQEGFEVTVYEPDDFSDILSLDGAESFRAKYDLVLYVANEENTSNKTVTRLKWHTVYGLGNNTPWFAAEVPTIFVSVANPYMLLDVSMVRTYINGYSNNEFVMRAVVDKLCGKSAFIGRSPVDPFCGREDTRY